MTCQGRWTAEGAFTLYLRNPTFYPPPHGCPKLLLVGQLSMDHLPLPPASWCLSSLVLTLKGGVFSAILARSPPCPSHWAYLVCLSMGGDLEADHSGKKDRGICSLIKGENQSGGAFKGLLNQSPCVLGAAPSSWMSPQPPALMSVENTGS